ncbi:hypothetical protein [Arthrobacter agilis]|uniref:hypothetical protein n=1 Tax=Arthrobacter agilis TaxID=37921 RepID=UPI00278B0206|nr:hypothetical protein [Arthrobacter agilis]MDQ0735330.1 hypothetical protein [Arthrobacter agilis]
MPFEPNDSFFSEIGTGPELTQMCVDKAEQIRSAAVSSAPVDSGAYKGSITVKVKRSARRNVAVVEASDPKSLLIESRTGNMARAVRGVKRG